MTYRDASKSPSTRRAYQGAVARFETFVGCSIDRATSHDAVEYLSRLADKGQSAATISQAVAALKSARPELVDAAVTETLAGIRRVIGTAPETTDPVLSRDLAAMLAVTDGQDRAILSLGWYAGLRRSELAGLDCGDILVTPAGVRVMIRASKGDQEGRGSKVDVPHLHPDGATDACAACLVSGLVQGRAADAPLFVTRTGARIPDGAVDSLVKKSAKAAGLAGDFSAHSLRAGCATELSRAGVPIADIARHLRHKSIQTTLRYVRAAESISESPVSKLGRE